MTSAASIGTQSPDDNTVSANRSSAVCRNSPVSAVRTLTPTDEATNLTLLSDDALADRIRFYDHQMQAAMKLGMKPEAHRCRLHFEAALRERHRRPHLVAAMESAKGLA